MSEHDTLTAEGFVFTMDDLGIPVLRYRGQPFNHCTSLEIKTSMSLSEGASKRGILEVFWDDGLTLEGNFFAEYGLPRGGVHLQLFIKPDTLGRDHVIVDGEQEFLIDDVRVLVEAKNGDRVLLEFTMYATRDGHLSKLSRVRGNLYGKDAVPLSRDGRGGVE